MENRNGLIVEACVTRADGHAERNAALAMIEGVADRPSKITVGADKAYDSQDFVNDLRAMNVTPHVARLDSLGIQYVLWSGIGLIFGALTEKMPSMRQTHGGYGVPSNVR